jgi:spore coat polysaccharide biosynthesis predicted glycosyltransferase SpsG
MVNIIVAENQKMIAAELAAAGVSLNLGWQQKLSVSRIAPLLSELFRAPQRRAQMAVRGKAMVDGLGVKRVVDTMLQESFLRAA